MEGSSSFKRSRLFPHICGNFPSFVCFPLAFDFDSIDVFGFHRLEDYHISISRTFPVPKKDVQRFTRLVSKVVSEEFSCFSVELCLDPCLFLNDNKETIFLALEVSKGQEELKRLSGLIDEVCSQMGLPEYYKSPKFHVSIAWMPNNNNARDREYEEKLNQREKKDERLRFEIDTCHLIVGEKISEFQLEEEK